MSLGSLVYGIMSSTNGDTGTSSFHICIHFISFSCLIAVVKTSSTMLSMSGESQHPCLFPDISGNALSSSLFSMILAVDLSSIAFIKLRYIPSIVSLVKVFIMKECKIVSKVFSAATGMIT